MRFDFSIKIDNSNLYRVVNVDFIYINKKSTKISTNRMLKYEVFISFAIYQLTYNQLWMEQIDC